MRTDNDRDEPEYDGDNIQLNSDKQSYGEKSTTHDNDNMNKNCDQEIIRAREILKQRKKMKQKSSKESKKRSTTSHNNTPRQVARRQTQSSRSMAIRTRSESLTLMISLEYLSDTRNYLTRLTEQSQCWLTEITKLNDPIENCPKVIKASMLRYETWLIEVSFELSYDLSFQMVRTW